MSSERIYHLALRQEWDEALASGAGYRRSTFGRSLDDEGFIHCSYATQVRSTAAYVFGDRDVELVLLEIDPSRVGSEIRVENGFPHIYGPLPSDAVVAVSPWSDVGAEFRE